MRSLATILVTRPSGQINNLIQALEKLNLTILTLPTLQILPAQDNTGLLTAMANLHQFDLAIFTSSNAVNYAMPYWPTTDLSSLTIASIGPATTQALQAHNIVVTLQPQTSFSTEALLQLPTLQHCENKPVIIFTGEDSRPLLSDTLIARGAKVSVAICYRRVLPDVDVLPVINAWNSIDIIIITSVASLHNLNKLIGQRVNLAEKKILVSSARIATAVKELGCHNILFAKDATDAAIMAAIKNHLTNL